MAYGDGYSGGYAGDGAEPAPVAVIGNPMTMLLRRRAVRATAFNPDAVAGRHTWFESDGTLWQEQARSTPATADNDPIGAWDDAKGGHHAVRALAAARPLLKTNVYNGKPAVRFDGTDDNLTTAAFTALAQPNTIFLVVKMLSNDAEWVVDGINAGNRHGFEKRTTTIPAIYAGTNEVDAGTFDTTTLHVWTLQFNGASSLVRLDGTQVGAGNAGAHTLTGIQLGCHVGAANYANIDLCVYGLYTGALSVGDMQYVEAGLKAKYATP